MRYLLLTLLLIPVSTLAQDYNRDEWRHWIDLDRDCQNTRQELLISTSFVKVTFTNEKECTVAAGIWVDSHTGRAHAQASELHVDHVIPLKYASDAGGWEWPPLLKELFANDLDNIAAISVYQNTSKGERGPSRYMPPTNQCEYVRKWALLANKYDLDLLAADKVQIKRTLEGCP